MTDPLREALAKAGREAKLPAHYQWGEDAMEQFRVGRDRTMEAMLAAYDVSPTPAEPPYITPASRAYYKARGLPIPSEATNPKGGDAPSNPVNHEPETRSYDEPPSAELGARSDGLRDRYHAELLAEVRAVSRAPYGYRAPKIRDILLRAVDWMQALMCDLRGHEAGDRRAPLPTSEDVADEGETTRGRVNWHSSGEDEGPDVGLSLGLGDGRLLWVGELANATVTEAGVDIEAHNSTWWIAMFDGDAVKVAGAVADQDAARDLFDAIAAWNTRVRPPSPASEEVLAMVHALRVKAAGNSAPLLRQAASLLERCAQTGADKP